MTMTHNPHLTLSAADTFLYLKKVAEDAQDAMNAARAQLVATMEQTDTDEVIASSGERVALERRDRVSYDYEYVAAHVAPNVLHVVSTGKIDAKRLRSALDLGLITSDVVDGASSVTEVQQVRVYPS